MKRNVGTMDRFLRLVISIPFMVYGFLNSSLLLSIVGIVIFFTGIVGLCGFYYLIGLDSCKSTDGGKHCQI